MHASIFIVFIFIIAVCCSVASLGYCLLCVVAGWSFASQRDSAALSATPLPPFSILKPLKGADPQMLEALRSHCMQDYPDYEILVGISRTDDSAAEIVRNLIAEFPQRKIRLVVCKERLGANGKVSTLAQLAPLAAHEFLLVNDSDIRVEPDYLRTIATELSQPGVGMVTCLYRGVPAETTPSKIEALGISTDFAPGVLTARLIERGLGFGLGSTLAFRRSDLEKIGGFEAIVDYLADDYELGAHIAGLGRQVKLSRVVVETNLPAYGWGGFFSHQLRWARTIRASRPGGYAGLVLTFTLPWALAAFCLAPLAWTGGLLGLAVVSRFAMAMVYTKQVLGDRRSLPNLWLLPARDFLAVVVWIGGLFGKTIVWRGERFTLDKGKLAAAGRPSDSGG